MKTPTNKAVLFLAALGAPALPLFAGTLAYGADTYPHYTAARSALARGDCPAAVKHLQAFLQKHAYVRKKYPGFYLDLKLIIGQCTGAVTVRGVEDESVQIDPLPERLPMQE